MMKTNNIDVTCDIVRPDMSDMIDTRQQGIVRLVNNCSLNTKVTHNAPFFVIR